MSDEFIASSFSHYLPLFVFSLSPFLSSSFRFHFYGAVANILLERVLIK